MNPVRRLSYAFLCIVPFLNFTVVVGMRALRIPGVYQAVGVAYFAAITLAAWILSAGAIRADAQNRKLLGLAGTLLLAPYALMSLLWVGIGPPWEATAVENEMRYLVLMVMSGAIVGGFAVVKEALSDAGEHSYASLGWAAIVLAGPLYLIWNAVEFGRFFGVEHAGAEPTASVSLRDTLDLLLSVGCSLTYLATMALAASLHRVQWLGRWPTRVYVILCGVAMLLLALRGVPYPDAKSGPEPWYTSAGFVVGIPAVPFIMPYLMGVVLLRRAGTKDR